MPSVGLVVIVIGFVETASEPILSLFRTSTKTVLSSSTLIASKVAAGSVSVIFTPKLLVDVSPSASVTVNFNFNNKSSSCVLPRGWSIAAFCINE